MDEEAMQDTMERLLEAVLGDGSAAHYLSAAFEATPYAFRRSKIDNITTALEVAEACWSSYEDVGEGYDFAALRRPVAGGETLTYCLEAFVGHQLAQHQEQGTPFPEAMTDIRRQWREFADNDAIFLPYVSLRSRRDQAEREGLM